MTKSYHNPFPPWYLLKPSEQKLPVQSVVIPVETTGISRFILIDCIDKSKIFERYFDSPHSKKTAELSRQLH